MRFAVTSSHTELLTDSLYLLRIHNFTLDGTWLVTFTRQRTTKGTVIPAFAQLWLEKTDDTGAPQSMKKVQDVEKFVSYSVNINVDFLRQRYAVT